MCAKEGNENMRVLTSRVVIFAIMSAMVNGVIGKAYAIPEWLDFKTVASKVYVDDEISALSAHTVNGAPLSNSASVFFDGAAGGAAGSPDKTASIRSITTLSAGTIITVLPQYTSKGLDGAEYTLRLNNFDRIPIYYNGGVLNGADAPYVWNSRYPSTFVYDGTYWVFMGNGQFDTNTTYTVMTDSTGTAGTSSEDMVVSPKVLKNSIQGVTLANNTDRPAFTVTNARMDATTTPDTILGALGKAQGQIDNRQYLAPATGNYLTLSNNTWTSASISDYDAVKGSALLTKTGTAGNLGERMIVDSDTATTGWSTAKLNNAIPSMSKLNALLPTTLTWGTLHNNATDAYSVTFGDPIGNSINPSNVWPSADQDKFVTTLSLARGLVRKQNVIPHVAAGTTATKIVTYPSASANDGAIGELTVDTASLYTTDDSHVPSSKLVDSEISALAAHTLNGAPISNPASVFFDGAGGGAAGSPEKTASIPSITTLSAGTIITVLPRYTSKGLNGAEYTLQLNNFNRIQIYYNGAALSAEDASYVWSADYPSTFVYDGTHWVFMGNGAPDIDTDTTYESMGVNEGTTGSATTQRTLTATNLKQIIQGTTLTGLDTSTATAITASDTVTTGMGKLQGQLLLKQNKIAATSNGADSSPNYVYDSSTNPTAAGSVVTTTTTAGVTGQRGIATAPTRDNQGNLTNGDWLPTMSAVVNATSDLASHTINGAPLSNSASYFYDSAGGGAATEGTKTVSIPAITSLAAGQIITVQPTTTHTDNATPVSIDLNGLGAKPVLYDNLRTNVLFSTNKQPVGQLVWNNKYPSTFVYTGADWKFLGHGRAMPDLKLSLTTSSDVAAANNYSVTFDGTSNNWPTTSETSVITTKALAGGLALKQNKLDATSNGADSSPNYVYDSTNNPTAAGSVVTTTTTAGLTGQRGIATAPTYDSNNALSNGDWLPTMSAVMSQISSATDTLTWDTAETASANAYETHFGSGTNYWPAADETKLINTSALAQGLALKQNVIPHVANGTRETKIVTYPDAKSKDGAIGELTVDTSELNKLDDTSVPSSKLVADQMAHTVNGAPLSNSASYFYGKGVGAADTATKTVTIQSITITDDTPEVGQVIIVNPETTNTSSTITINLNNTQAYPVRYRDSSNNIPVDVWTAGVPSVFVFDSTGGNKPVLFWRYVGMSPNALSWSIITRNATNAYSTTFDGTSNNWTAPDAGKYVKGDSFANGLALKQNKITTGLVDFTDPEVNTEYQFASLVSYDTTSGITGNKIGIYPLGPMVLDDWYNWVNLANDNAAAYLDNYVPTVRAVAAGFQNIFTNMPQHWSPLVWDAASNHTYNTDATNAYSRTFANSNVTGTDEWPQNDANKLVNGTALAEALYLKQNKIPAGTFFNISNDTLPGIVTTTSAPGVVGERMILDHSNQAYGSDIANMFASNNTWDVLYSIHVNAIGDAEIRASIPTTGSVMLGLNQKQNKITTGLVDLHDDGVYMLPAITTYDSTSGLVANKIGILDQTTIRSDEGLLEIYGTTDYGTEMDNFVPTVRAVADAVRTFVWQDNKHPEAISAYSTNFGTGTGDWPSTNNNALVKGDVLANSLALKQNKLDAKASNARAQAVIRESTAGNTASAYITAGGSVGLTTLSGAPAVMNYVNGTVATSADMSTFTSGTFGSDNATNQDYIKGALVSLELLKDVYDRVKRPTGTSGKAVTYNGTDTNGVQQFGEATIAHNLTYTIGANPTVSNLNDIASVELVLNAGGNYQPIIQPSTVNGATQIITKPAYGGTAGDISYLTLDTASLNTIDDSHVPSSKLVASQITDLSSHKVNGAPISNMASYFYGTSSTDATTATKNVSIPSITGTPQVGQVIIVKPTVTNTSSTLKINLNNTTAYSVSYKGSTSNIPVEAWTAWVPSIFVLDESSGGTQYFWRYVGTSPTSMAWSSTETTATNAYSTTFDGASGNWPAADETKYITGGGFAQGLALKQNILPATSSGISTPLGGQTIALTSTAGVPEVRYITKGINDRLTTLTTNTGVNTVGDLLYSTDSNSYRLMGFANFGSGQEESQIKVKNTLVSLELLKDVYDRVKRPTGTTGTVVIYNGTDDANGAQQFGEKTIDTTVTSSSDNLITSGAVYTADLGRQNTIPAAGSVRDSTSATTNTEIRDWTDRNIKGTALVSKTGADGIVGERKIFEPDATYTNDEDTNIQIATIGAVKANTLQKVCAEYKPGTTVANQNAANCWLWTVQIVVPATSCENPRSCRGSSDCCDGYGCNNGVCEFRIELGDDNSRI